MSSFSFPFRSLIAASQLTVISCTLVASALAESTEQNSEAFSPQPVRLEAPASEERASILDPTQGRPIILMPNDQFRFLIRFGPDLGNMKLLLRHAQVPSLTRRLEPIGQPSIFLEWYASLSVQIPEGVQPGLYDLVMQTEGRAIESLRSVKIVDAFVMIDLPGYGLTRICTRVLRGATGGG